MLPTQPQGIPLETTTVPTKSTDSPMGKILALIAIVLILPVVSWYVFNYFKNTTTVQNTAPNQTYLDLKENAQFEEAVLASKNRDYTKALSLYSSVPTSNNDEYSFLQFEIANAKLGLNREEGAEAFSQLLASSSINTQTKSYSVNALARTYSTSHDTSFLNKLKQLSSTWETSESLISELKQATNSDDGYMALLEIGSSYFPITDSEIRLAFLYAKEARDAKNSGNLENFEKYKNKTLEKIALADSDPNNTKISENLSWMLPLALNRKAMTLELLKRLNVETEDPGKYFEQALNLSAAQGVETQAFILFHYSTFLMKTDGDKEKIKSLLTKIVENKESPSVVAFIEFTKNAFKNKETTNINDLNDLAKIYPPFEEIIK